MQDKSDLKSDFSDRTDALAVKLGVRIVDLPTVLGLSADMLMGYRTGRYSISGKAWKKLEAAEALHGLARPLPVSPGIDGLCARIRDEFYLPNDEDFTSLLPGEKAKVLRAMADAVEEMERRSAAYSARASREGLAPPGQPAAAANEADAVIDSLLEERDAAKRTKTAATKQSA